MISGFRVRVDWAYDDIDSQQFEIVRDVLYVLNTYDVKMEVYAMSGPSGWPEIDVIGSKLNVMRFIDECGFEESYLVIDDDECEVAL